MVIISNWWWFLNGKYLNNSYISTYYEHIIFCCYFKTSIILVNKQKYVVIYILAMYWINIAHATPVRKNESKLIVLYKTHPFFTINIPLKSWYYSLLMCRNVWRGFRRYLAKYSLFILRKCSKIDENWWAGYNLTTKYVLCASFIFQAQR